MNIKKEQQRYGPLLKEWRTVAGR